MPRIDAPTVAEHHELRRRALIAAGRTLLGEKGPDAVTPGAVGAAAGIARSSVYQYFSSTSELVAAIVEDAFESANATIRDALAATTDPRGRLEAYLTVSLALATGPSHRMFDEVDPASLPDATRARIDALHREQLAPLADAVASCGAPEPHLAVHLVAGMLHASARAIQAGADPAETERALLRAVRSGPVPADD